jgi:hypothetical protein
MVFPLSLSGAGTWFSPSPSGRGRGEGNLRHRKPKHHAGIFMFQQMAVRHIRLIF